MSRENQYLAASSFRFMQGDINEQVLEEWHQGIIHGSSIRVSPQANQLRLFEKAAQHRTDPM